MLVDTEMKMFAGLPAPDVPAEHRRRSHPRPRARGMCSATSPITCGQVRRQPGFITKNLPRLLELLEEVGIENPIVCANINKIGFRMSGGIESYERTLATRVPGDRDVGMASGAIHRRRRWNTSARCRTFKRSCSALPVGRTSGRRSRSQTETSRRIQPQARCGTGRERLEPCDHAFDDENERPPVAPRAEPWFADEPKEPIPTCRPDRARSPGTTPAW